MGAYENALVKVQNLANTSALKVQQLANKATQETFKFNSAEAAKNRAWEKQMSDTSHQREVADLKKAGLNPVLSANQGAMSYTSASASAQAESGASASSGIYGSSISALSGLASSQMQSAASLKAAKAQAAAMKKSAEASAAAQRYAADRAYASNKYAWDKKLEMQKYEYKNKPAGNIWSLADKYLSKIGFTDKVVAGAKSILRGTPIQDLVKTWKSNNDFTLSKVGYQKMNAVCSQLGIAQTKNNRYLVFKAINGNQRAINTLKNYKSSKRYSQNRVRSRYQR